MTGIVFKQSAQSVDVPSPGTVLDRARPQEQQALEQGVIQDVQQGAGESQEGHDGNAIGQPQESDAQPERE